MNIGPDIDGTITRHLPSLALLSTAFKSQGRRVLILGFPEDRDSAIEDLTAWSIAWDMLETLDQATFAGDEVFAWKAEKCIGREIDVLFGDTPEVAQRLDHERTVCLVPVHPDLHDLERMVGPFQGAQAKPAQSPAGRFQSARTSRHARSPSLLRQ